jgi:hypothetical protein
MPKLTLSADRKVIEQARKLARENNTSISSMFARFIRMLAVRRKSPRHIGPIARRAIGLVSLPKGKTSRDVLVDALVDRYGLDK